MLDDLKTAFANRQLVQMLCLLFAVQTVAMLLQPLIALYISELQGTMEGAALTAGIVYSLAGIAGAIAAPLWGRIGQRRGFAQVLTIAFLGAGLFSFSQYFSTDIYQFSVLQFLYGLFVVGVFPAINTTAVSCTDPNSRGRVLA